MAAGSPRTGQRKSLDPASSDSAPTGPGGGASARAADRGIERQERRRPWLLEIYGTAVGKKYVMALTGIALMGFVLAHTVGNLKLYLGAEAMNFYGEWLRDIAYPALPHSGFLWLLRIMLLVAVILHIHASYGLTRMNQRARPTKYASKRDYVAVTFAARTMRWTGVIVLLFIVFHLLDLTWGAANPDFVHGDAYGNTVRSFQRIPVSLFYIVANLALGLHLYHGAWSLFQSLGVNNRRFNHWRRWFATAFAGFVTFGNITFPIAVLARVIT